MYIDSIGLDDGLSQSSILCMVQDATGFLWIGTQYGLNRFDGTQFRVYPRKEHHQGELGDPSVLDLLIDQGGTLWVATHRGVYTYSESLDVFSKVALHPDPEHPFNQSGVSKVFEDRRGYVWIHLSYGEGLMVFDPRSKTVEPVKLLGADDVLREDVYSVYQWPDGRIWFGTPAGIYIAAPDELVIQPLVLPDGHAKLEGRVGQIGLDETGRLLLISEGQLWTYREQSGFILAYEEQQYPGLNDQHVSSFLADNEGIVWIGTSKGLIWLAPATKEMRVYDADPGDPHSGGRQVDLIFQDRAGTVWLASESSGLFRVKPGYRNFAHYKPIPGDADSLSGASIRSMLVDSQERVWVGTFGFGLNRWDREAGRFVHYRSDGPRGRRILEDTILGLEEDSAGRIWISTLGGVHALLPESGELLMPEDLDPELGKHTDRLVYDVFEAHDKRLYFGTNHGLVIYDPAAGQTRHLPPDPGGKGPIQDDIMMFAQDRDGGVWMSTFGGVSRYLPETQTFAHYGPRTKNDPHGLSSSEITDIHIDGSGHVWVATLSGLHRFDPERDGFRHFGLDQGLPDEGIYSVLSDSTGQLWLGSNAGLISFDLENQRIQQFLPEDGIQSSEFNQGGRAKGRRGELYIGGINGLNVFNPFNIRTGDRQPQAVITDFLLFNRSQRPMDPQREPVLTQSMHLTRNVQLSHRDYLFSFEFADLQTPEAVRNRYAYRMEGLDHDWIYTDANNRRATYTKLAPGQYTFHVKAANHHGLWQEQPTSVRLRILPPFYKTWWAYAGYFVAAVGFIFLGYGLRTRGLRRQLEREKFVNEKLSQIDKLKDDFLASTSHELRTPLHGMIGLAESLRDGAAGDLPFKALKNLNMIVASGRRLTRIVDDVLDFSKLKNHSLTLRTGAVDLHALTQVVLTFLRPLVGQKPVRLINKVPTSLPPVLADENRLQQMMYNLVGNGVKFTPEGEVEIRATRVGTKVEVAISDTGIGIGEADRERIFEFFERGADAVEGAFRGTGLGLAITTQLVHLQQGEIWLEESSAEGSTFCFTLPIYTGQTEGADTIQPLKDGRSSLQHLSTYDLEPSLPLVDSPELPVASHPQTDRFHILIVDDDTVNRQVLVDHLGIRGFKVSQAGSGLEALQAIDQDEPFDLVLLDVMMPQMSGYEVCQQIRTRFPVHELPVIFLTAKSRDTDLVAGFEAGANDYLTKPIFKGELVSRVETHIKLLDVNRNLERKVTERTMELDQKNQELAALNLRLEKAAVTDPLTGLGNRRYLDHYLERELSLVRRIFEGWQAAGKEGAPPDADLVFLMFDLDHFKRINDRFGHAAGDRVLNQLSTALEKVAREYDVMVRWGGEEFVLVIRNVHRDEVDQLAERLRRGIAEHTFDLGNSQTCRITASIGGAVFPFLPSIHDLLSWEQVVEIADMAVYLAKHNGRDAWVTLTALTIPRQDDLFSLLRQDLRQAVVNGTVRMSSSIEAEQIQVWPVEGAFSK